MGSAVHHTAVGDDGGAQEQGLREALTCLVEAVAEEPRPHRDGFLLREQVTPIAGGSWDVELSVVL